MLSSLRALTTKDAFQLPLSLTPRDPGQCCSALVFLGKDRKYCGARVPPVKHGSLLDHHYHP